MDGTKIQLEIIYKLSNWQSVWMIVLSSSIFKSIFTKIATVYTTTYYIPWTTQDMIIRLLMTY